MNVPRVGRVSGAMALAIGVGDPECRAWSGAAFDLSQFRRLGTQTSDRRQQRTNQAMSFSQLASRIRSDNRSES